MIQDFQDTLTRIKTNKTTHRHITVKWHKTED